MSTSVEIPSYRKHRASGQAIVTLCGKDIYLGPHGTQASRDEYDRVVAEWIVQGRQLPSVVAQSGLTVEDLMAAYLLFAKTYYVRNGKLTTEYSAIKHACKPLRQLYGRTFVTEFGPIALKAVREKFVAVEHKRRHINHRINRIRRMFKWGVENEIVPATILHALQAIAPLKRGRTSAPESVAVKPVPDEQVEPVIKVVSRQVATMIQLQRLTGMRPGEVVLMRGQDIDQSGAVWIFRPEYHKTDYQGYDREIYIGSRAQEILKPWLAREPEKYCFSPLEAENERNQLKKANRKSPMTPSQSKRKLKKNPKRPKRDRYDTASYRRAIKYATGKLKIQDWHPHQLRHSCATEIRKKHGLDAAQLILGHKSADVTQIYAELDRAKAVQIVEQIG